MKAFLYGVSLQWKLDIRSKTLLITCYLVPILFFIIMSSIFTSIMPDFKETLIPSMTVFGVTMGALIGLPPSLVEIYGRDTKNVYQANGVPLSLGVALTNISAFLHLFLMSVILYFLAPLAFDAKIPETPAQYWTLLAIFIAVSLSIASIIGLWVKDQAKTPLFSILAFLPSVMLSGIMFPSELLPRPFATVGKIFPASWGYKLLTDHGFNFQNLWPLLLIFLFAVLLCAALLNKTKSR